MNIGLVLSYAIIPLPFLQNTILQTTYVTLGVHSLAILFSYKIGKKGHALAIKSTPL